MRFRQTSLLIPLFAVLLTAPQVFANKSIKVIASGPVTTELTYQLGALDLHKKLVAGQEVAVINLIDALRHQEAGFPELCFWR